MGIRYASAWLLAGCTAFTLASACSSSKSGDSCNTGDEGCACFSDDTCGHGLSCLSKLCVRSGGSSGGGANVGSGGGEQTSRGGRDASSGGSENNGEGGAGNTDPERGGSSSRGGAATSGGKAQGGGSAEGGSENPARGGSGNSPSRGGSDTGRGGADDGRGGADEGHGGSPRGGASSGGRASGGSGNEVSDPAIIDNFSSCDGNISRVAGRDGYWYTFGDNDVNVTPNTNGATPAPAASSPPSAFSDSSCAAWVTGGCAPSADACAYGGNGFTFHANRSGFDVSGYDGIQFDYEGGELWVVVTTSHGDTFGTTIAASNGSRRTRSFAFADLVASGETSEGTELDLSSVRQIDFTTVTPAGFGLAVWEVRFF